MRKVFISAMPEALLAQKQISYISQDYDFDFDSKKYDFALSYFVDEQVKGSEDILFITLIKPNQYKNHIQDNFSEENYTKYQNEIKQIINTKTNVNASFKKISCNEQFDGGHNIHVIFRDLVALINEDDTIFMDFTDGEKPYSLTMALATTTAISLCKNSELSEAIYCRENRQKREVQEIHTISGLGIMLSLAKEQFRPGEKQAFDTCLKTIIRD